MSKFDVWLQADAEVKVECEWLDVGIIRGSVCTVQCYYRPGGLEFLSSYATAEGDVTDRLPQGTEIK